MIELNRSIDFFDYLAASSVTDATKWARRTTRGICFDEFTGSFLTNQQVGQACAAVSEQYLDNKPIDILCVDACLMQGIGFAYSLKPYKGRASVRYVTGSQEVILATGLPYDQLFPSKLFSDGSILGNKQPFFNASDFCIKFAKNTVEEFGVAYAKITPDYTHSAIDLLEIDPLYENIDIVGKLLIESLMQQKNGSVCKFIDRSSNRPNCTYFEEPTYKDLHHLWCNMITNINIINLQTKENTHRIRNNLVAHLQHGCALIQKIVMANVTGENLKKAAGISIYVPEKRIDPSFGQTDFGKNNSWFECVALYMEKKRALDHPSKNITQIENSSIF